MSISKINPGLFKVLKAPSKVNLDVFVEATKGACAIFDITTDETIAALLGQCAVECVNFSRLEESLYYTTQSLISANFSKVRALPSSEQVKLLRNPEGLANVAYADRYGNGNPASGDGWKYRGRGGIQTTFKANYEAAEKLTGRPYVEQPDLLSQPSDAMLSAAAYFRGRGCVEVSSRGITQSNIMAVTRMVNAAKLEAERRWEYTQAAYKYLKAS